MGDDTLESRLYADVTGVEMSPTESFQKGGMLCTLERALAVRDGRRREDDAFHNLYFEKQDAGGRRYTREQLEQSKSDYYRLMGWDSETGEPTLSALRRVGLKDVAEEMVMRNAS